MTWSQLWRDPATTGETQGFQGGLNQGPTQRVTNTGIQGIGSNSWPGGIPSNQWTSGSSQQQAQTTTGQTSEQQSAQAGRTGVEDVLGMGPLIQQTAGTAMGVDTARNANLGGLAAGTDPRYAANINNAVRNATTGPASVGAGKEGNIRSAVDAGMAANSQNVANQISANQNMGTAAANQAIPLASPYNTTVTEGTASQLSNELTSGLAQAFNQNYAIGAGPQSTSTTTSGGGGGGTVLCTMTYHEGDLPRAEWVATVYKGEELGKAFRAGYHYWAIPLSVWSHRSPWVYRIVRWFVRHYAGNVAGTRRTLVGKILVPVVNKISIIIGQQLLSWKGISLWNYSHR